MRSLENVDDRREHTQFMDDTIIRQVPFAREDDVCPLCGNHLSEHKTITVQSDYYPKYSFDFLYCPYCDIPFTNVEIGKQIREQTHFGQRAFTPRKNCTSDFIKGMMVKESQIPSDVLRKMQLQNRPKTHPHTFLSVKAYEFIKRNHPQHLIIYIEPLKCCPQCDKMLDYYSFEIPITDDNLNILHGIDGKYCLLCDTIYIYDKKSVIKLLQENLPHYYASITRKRIHDIMNKIQSPAMDEHNHEQNQDQNQVELRKYNSSVVMIIVSFQNGVSQKYVIVNDSKEENREVNAFHYSSNEALELLSAAFAKQRNQKGILLGQEYDVKLIVYKAEKTSALPEKFLPTYLTIQSGGGLYDKSRAGHLEVVDMLVYSPFSQRYELIKATYDKCDEYCYMDISVYRRFVKDHGKPDLQLDFERYYGDRCFKDFDELKNQSILKVFGYSVKKGDNLSPQHRQRILAEIIDLELLTVKGVISLLDFFISTHNNDKYSDARRKWEADKKFVAEYKVNPQRFLIAK